jgi:hypothetical protein
MASFCYLFATMAPVFLTPPCLAAHFPPFAAFTYSLLDSFRLILNCARLAHYRIAMNYCFALFRLIDLFPFANKTFFAIVLISCLPYAFAQVIPF